MASHRIGLHSSTLGSEMCLGVPGTIPNSAQGYSWQCRGGAKSATHGVGASREQGEFLSYDRSQKAIFSAIFILLHALVS